MNKILFFAIISSILVACSTTKKTVSPDNLAIKGASILAGDGLSYETAIIIKAKNETTGVSMEYVWLKEHYPGYSLLKQSLKNHEQKAFDVMHIKTAEATEKEIYFDITDFFGKF